MERLQGKNSAFFAKERGFWEKFKPIWLRLRKSLNTHKNMSKVIHLSHKKKTSYREKKAKIDILLIFLLGLITGFPSLAYPFGRDQGEYAWIAASIIKGNISYRDIFNVKPPLTHLIHQVALLSFGYGMTSIRIFDLAWQIITAILIYKISSKAKQTRAASVLAASLYLFLYFQLSYWNTAQTDGFLSLPIAAGILFFLEAEQRKNLLFYGASGFFISLGVLFKYPIGILLIFLSLIALYQNRTNGHRILLWLGFGFAIPLGLCAIFMSIQGNLIDFLTIQFAYIPKYATISHSSKAYGHGLLTISLVIAKKTIPGLVSFIGISSLFQKGDSTKKYYVEIFAIWWASALIHLYTQNKFYLYHTIPLYAPLALLISSFFSSKEKKQESIHFALGALGVALIVANFYSVDFPQKYIRIYNIVHQDKTLQTIYQSQIFDVGKDFSSRATINVAKYIKSKTSPDQKVFIWGFEPGVYFLSQRMNATRFIYNFPLYGPNASTALKQEFIKDIQAQKPTYILILRNDNMFHVTGTDNDSWIEFNRFNEFYNFVIENYQFETSIEDFEIYHIKR